MNGCAFPTPVTKAGPGGRALGTRTPRAVWTQVPHPVTLAPGQGLRGVAGAACSPVSGGAPHPRNQQQGTEILSER